MKCNKYETKSGKEIRLWQGDCMELMDGKPENHWDLAIVDPPYGLDMDGYKTFPKSGNGSDWPEKEWDKNKPEDIYFANLLSRSENQIIWGANHFTDCLYESRGWVVWNKNTNGHFSDAELAWTSFDKPIKAIDFTWDGFRQGYKGHKENRIHVTQKPVFIYREILKTYAEEGDTILDTHGGSMSLAIACYIEDFELDIIELDEDYYNNAVQRFEQHISQKTLF